LAVFLWPAIAAPVVRWADSEIDLQWAREGLGIFRPAAVLGHAAKPGYLLFLRTLITLAPRHPDRAIVVTQSILVWSAIAGAALIVSRKRGFRWAVAVYLLLILFLRLRDSCSAVMPEALSAALLLPIAATLVEPPARKSRWALLGLATAALFLVRPNVGGVALLMVLLSATLSNTWREVPAFLICFVLLAAPFWIATRPPRDGDPLRGLSYQILEASVDDFWKPAAGPWPKAHSPREQSREELRGALENWRGTLNAKGPDARRQLSWRAFRGFLAYEHYDARWSPLYRRFTAASRVASPFLVLASAAIFLAALFTWRTNVAKSLGLLVIVLLIGQNLILGSNPRYVLPFLPALFVLAVSAFSSGEQARLNRPIAAAALFTLLIALTWSQRSVLGSEWGKIESSGVVIRQPIPRRALPARAPATFHLRIAPPLVPSNADLVVRVDGKDLFSTASLLSRERPDIAIPLPQWLLDQNGREAVELELVSVGDYGETSYLLFPVIPPPWGRAARRIGSPDLSPGTGCSGGSLDWWAHTDSGTSYRAGAGGEKFQGQAN